MPTATAPRALKALSPAQLEFFHDNGYLPYGRVLSDEQLAGLRGRTDDIAEGRAAHVPPRYVQFESGFQAPEENSSMQRGARPLADGDGEAGTPRLDAVRKLQMICYFDELFEATAKSAPIVDVIEDLMASPDIKLYTDQLLMKPRYNGTPIQWHQVRTLLYMSCAA